MAGSPAPTYCTGRSGPGRGQRPFPRLAGGGRGGGGGGGGGGGQPLATRLCLRHHAPRAHPLQQQWPRLPASYWARCLLPAWGPAGPARPTRGPLQWLAVARAASLEHRQAARASCPPSCSECSSSDCEAIADVASTWLGLRAKIRRPMLRVRRQNAACAAQFLHSDRGLGARCTNYLASRGRGRASRRSDGGAS